MKIVLFRLLKKPFFGRFMVPWRNPLPAAERKNWEPIRLKSKTGAEIQLLWYQQENARGTIVLGHPMGKAAKGVFLKNSHTQRLIEKGFNVMLYDFNGFGESQMGNFNFYDDAEAVAIKAKALSPGLRLGYHGISLGGMWICPVLSRKTSPFEFVILESAATTLPEFWKHYPLANKVLRFSFLFIPKHAEYLKPINHISNLKSVNKLFLIYSDTDAYTPLEMGERFRASANTNVELWNASGAEHALAYKTYGEVYWDKVIGFFDNQFYKE